MEIDSEIYCVSKQQYVILCGLEEAWFFKRFKRNYSCCRDNASCREELDVIAVVDSIWLIVARLL